MCWYPRRHKPSNSRVTLQRAGEAATSSTEQSPSCCCCNLAGAGAVTAAGCCAPLVRSLFQGASHEHVVAHRGVADPGVLRRVCYGACTESLPQNKCARAPPRVCVCVRARTAVPAHHEVTGHGSLRKSTAASSKLLQCKAFRADALLTGQSLVADHQPEIMTERRGPHPRGCCCAVQAQRAAQPAGCARLSLMSLSCMFCVMSGTCTDKDSSQKLSPTRLTLTLPVRVLSLESSQQAALAAAHLADQRDARTAAALYHCSAWDTDEGQRLIHEADAAAARLELGEQAALALLASGHSSCFRPQVLPLVSDLLADRALGPDKG